MLGKLLDEEIARRGISQREASRQIGVSHTTLVAVKRGRPLEVDTAYLICKWLGVPLTMAVNEAPDEERLFALVSSVLKTEPELEEIFALAARETENGTLSKDDFREILEFAIFKINQRREKAQIQKVNKNKITPK